MSNNIIDSIQLSGTVYTIQGTGGGSGNPTVELTQAEYDALVSAGTVSANTYYIITDAQEGDLTQYWTSAQTNSAITEATSGKVDSNVYTAYTASTDTAIQGKQDTLVSGTNIKTINNESILGSGNIDIQGGGKAIEAGRGITVTTGETADTVSFNLPISATSSDGGLIFNIIDGNSKNNAGGQLASAFGVSNEANGRASFVIGASNTVTGEYSFAGGDYSVARGICSFAFGYMAKAIGNYSIAFGSYFPLANNTAEVAIGKANVSHTGSTDADKTLFSVGNGTNDNIRHNAFEIRQNGDIYLSSGGTDIKLQDHLGGGGASYSAGTGIDITNDVISVTGKADTSAVTAIQDSLSGYVTTGTEQTISGRKVFTYTSSGAKAIEFKQTNDSAKVGFGIKNSASTNNEVASFEFRPNTFTIDGVQHPLMYFGHYRNNNTANAGVPQTVIGFRQYDQKNAAAYHYLMPLPEKAKTPFSLTTSFKDYYAPMGFKNGSTMITADNTGVADFSSVLGGLKLVKLSQSDYNALTTKDDNTVYFIGDSTNGYTMKIGSANVN